MLTAWLTRAVPEECHDYLRSWLQEAQDRLEQIGDPGGSAGDWSDYNSKRGEKIIERRRASVLPRHETYVVAF
jgi:hypothetical protein